MTEFKILGQRRGYSERFDPNLAEKIEAWDRELTLKEEAEKRRMELEARLRPEAKPAEDDKPTEEANPLVASGSGYDLMDMANTYALGVHALREGCENDPGCGHPKFVKKDGSSIYRPLTFDENIRARLDDYNTLQNPDGSARSDAERLRLFNTYLDGCTGIAYKKESTLFKIITESDDLVRISENFNKSYYPVNYSRLQGVELDSSQGIYNHLLGKRQVLNHPGWNAAVTDNSLLKDYAGLIFRLRNGNNLGFQVRQNTSKDELRALCVKHYQQLSVADGGGNLDNGGRFVRVTHVAPKAP